jgi:hypothetical protein
MKNEFERQRQTVKRLAENRSRQLLEYGVPGMKWGTRKDASLPTPLGKYADKASQHLVAANIAQGIPPRYAKAVLGKAHALALLSARAGGKVYKAKTTLGKQRLRALSKAADTGRKRLFNAGIRTLVAKPKAVKSYMSTKPSHVGPTVIVSYGKHHEGKK